MKHTCRSSREFAGRVLLTFESFLFYSTSYIHAFLPMLDLEVFGYFMNGDGKQISNNKLLGSVLKARLENDAVLSNGNRQCDSPHKPIVVAPSSK
jgi:hypothetical protein